MKLRTAPLLLLTTALLAAACDGGSADSTSSSTGTGGTSSTGDTMTTGGSGGSGSSGSSSGSGGSSLFVPPTPFAVPLSATGPDQLQSVTAAQDGYFLAAGFAAAAVSGPRLVTVVKYSPTGFDMAFGKAGVVTTTLVFVGGTDEIDIATQSDGKILVSATVANAVNPSDRDVAVIRLLADGTADSTFGKAGVATLNLNDAHDNGMMLVGLDSSRGLTVDGSDNVFVHAISRGLGNAMSGDPRTDTDFTVVKLTKDGGVDMNFGTGGQFRLDIAEANATARGIKALADGSLLASGYASTPDVGDTVQPVLYKLTKDGALDVAFAEGGLFHEPVLTIQTEVYNFVLHGNELVTAGYGRNTGTTNDYVSMRFDLTTGKRDLTWGGAPNGAVLVDPSGKTLGSNARSAVGLPGGKTIIIGSTGPGNQPVQDAVFVVLDANGKLDTAYGTGIHVLPLGKNGNDQFWGGAVSGEHVSLVGYQGGGAMQTDMTNDDAYGVVFKIR
jgi:uncharacterized delta-60 repeat protein